MASKKDPTEKTVKKLTAKGAAPSAAAKVQGPASYFPSIERTYGKPIEHWMTVIAAAATGTRKHMELVAHLKADHDLGHGHANALVAHWLANNETPFGL
jgi:Domain of unknown function (DUF4287)